MTAREILEEMIKALDANDQEEYAELFRELQKRHREAYVTLMLRKKRTEPHP